MPSTRSSRRDRPVATDLLPGDARAPGGRTSPSASGRLRASWLRSRRYQVSAERVSANFVGQYSTDSLLYECGSHVLRGLAGTVSGEPISMMVTDADGLVLVRVCDDDKITRALDRVHLAPGFSYGESVVGTNGLGLALADRAPALVHATDHFCSELRTYTCAAVPVLGPGGELAGAINLTTWSDQSSDLLLALAQAAAGTTSALMHLRAGGLPSAATPRGSVFQVVGSRLPGVGPDPCGSTAWRDAVQAIYRGLRQGRLVAVIGEPGAGKAAAAAYALTAARPGFRLMRAPLRSTSSPEEWLARWLPELSAASTCMLAGGMDALPAWAGDRLVAAISAVGPPVPVMLTATELGGLPGALTDIVDAVVEVPPLRHRPDDILPLAAYFARSGHRDVDLAGEVNAALLSHDWPGNANELGQVVQRAAARTDRVTLAHLPADVFTRRTGRLTRLERVERAEIVRCLTEPGVTVSDAARSLGLSRATLYRKLSHYGLELPNRA